MILSSLSVICEAMPIKNSSMSASRTDAYTVQKQTNREKKNIEQMGDILI